MRAQWPRHSTVVSAASLALRRGLGAASLFRAGLRLAARVWERVGVERPGEGSAAPGSEGEVGRGRKVGGRRARAGKAVGEKRGAATGERGTAPAPRQGRGRE